jgi:CTP:molybdopterin cytidylyltransferase MocA
MGRPKALVGDWLLGSIGVLKEGGCDAVTVVLGAAADQAQALLPPERDTDGDIEVVIAADWAAGMGASLTAGLTALATTGPEVEAVLVHLVDLPDVGPDVVRRLLAGHGGRQALARATYGGVPGHPVLLGRDHWPGVLATATGDQGARAYLRFHEATAIECGDLASGRDVDTRPDRDQP